MGKHMDELLCVKTFNCYRIQPNLVHAFKYFHKEGEVRDYVAEARWFRFREGIVYGKAYLRAFEADYERQDHYDRREDQFYFLGQGNNWNSFTDEENSKCESLVAKFLDLDPNKLLWKIASNGYLTDSIFLSESIPTNHLDNLAQGKLTHCVLPPSRMGLSYELLRFAFAPIDQAVAQLYQIAKSMNFGEKRC